MTDANLRTISQQLYEKFVAQDQRSHTGSIRELASKSKTRSIRTYVVANMMFKSI